MIQQQYRVRGALLTPFSKNTSLDIVDNWECSDPISHYNEDSLIFYKKIILRQFEKIEDDLNKKIKTT